MSHFAVMVVSKDVENVERLLAPFHEFECTGQDDEFVVDVDITEEVRAEAAGFKESEANLTEDEALHWALEWRGLDERIISDEGEIDKAGPHKFGYALLQDGKLIKAVDRTNPNKRWDWWVIGGRWGSSLLLKNGSRENVATVGNIDFDGIEAETAKRMADRYDLIVAAKTWHLDLWNRVATLPKFNTLLKEITEHNKSIPEGGVKRDLGKEYWSEDRTALRDKLTTDKVVGFFSNLDDAMSIAEQDRDVFIKASSVGSWLTYAVVQDNADGKPEWISKGEMGWFGMSNDDMTENEWREKMTKHIRELPDNTVITVVDCHI